jgi:hypothetical protein
MLEIHSKRGVSRTAEMVEWRALGKRPLNGPKSDCACELRQCNRGWFDFTRYPMCAAMEVSLAAPRQPVGASRSRTHGARLSR